MYERYTARQLHRASVKKGKGSTIRGTRAKSEGEDPNSGGKGTNLEAERGSAAGERANAADEAGKRSRVRAA